MAGLLRTAQVHVHDTLIGLSDGAKWIEDAFAHLGVTQHVLDVYHSSMYLERVMQALGWDVREREQHRKAWVRGEHAARDWLAQHVPKQPSRRDWNEEAASALHYLQARVDQMDYPTYRAQGWPIGSGQIEGMNKHVIGNRMKRSGMRWSRSGAGRMAALRAQVMSRCPLARFTDLRYHAFPIPSI